MENLPSRRLEHKGAYRSSLRLVHLAACSLWLAACGLQLAACGLWLVACAACSLWLVACSLWLVQLAACSLWFVACGLRLEPWSGAHHLCREPAKTPTQSRQLFKQFQNPYIYSPQNGPEAYHPSRDGPTYREIHRPTSLAREHLREQLGIGYRERPHLRGNAGRTHLAPIPGFPPFVDDIYLYGRLLERDTVRVGNRVSCTTGEHGSAARIVSQISLFVREVWPPGEHKHIHVSIANTVAVGSGTRIPQTIQGIEERDEGRLASTWQSIHGGERAAAFFVAKMDVSELPIATLHAGLPKLQRLLVANGMSLYQVDYTQDFSGTLDRKALVQHLEEVHRFAYQGQVPPQNPQGCILDNTSSVGNHVCTFVSSTGTRAFSTKLYNKFVAQIQAGDVRGTFGGHMSGTVASTNQHLRQTLAHPDVLARGCTRLEISIYGCLVEELDAAKTEAMLERALQMATPEGEGSDTGLFVVQPLAKLWENYASCLDRCFVLADRPQGAIYVDWSGNSQTGRLQGVLVRPQKAQVERDVSWRRAIDWSMSDFALRGCPIFLAEILAVDGEDVVFAPLRCYTKDAPTILCASTRPCELHTNGPNLQELLPPTRVVECALSGCGPREAWIAFSPARKASSKRNRASAPGARSPGFPTAPPRTGRVCESRCCRPNPFGPTMEGKSTGTRSNFSPSQARKGWRRCENYCKARKPRTFSRRKRRKGKSWSSATPWSCKEGGSPQNKRTALQPSTWRKASMLFSGSRKPATEGPSEQSCIWPQWTRRGARTYSSKHQCGACSCKQRSTTFVPWKSCLAGV